MHVGACGRHCFIQIVSLPLCQLPTGAKGRIHLITGDAGFCQRLRELGFGESALVTKIRGQGPILCQVNGARIALGHAAAAHIVVNPISA